MNPKNVFSHFGLSEEVQDAVTSVQTLLEAKEAVLSAMNEKIIDARMILVNAIAEKLAEAIDLRLGKKWSAKFKTIVMRMCIDGAINWNTKMVDSIQHLSFSISREDLADLGVTPDEYIARVNHCWENGNGGEGPTFARLGKSWDNESQLIGQDTITMYFTLTLVFDEVGSDR